jgi:transcriptional regulator with XRE-family HTH domain
MILAMTRPVTPLRLAIAASGRTQREIADTLGISEEHLSRIVNGLHASQRMRESIAEEIGQTVEDLWPISTPKEAA